MTELPEETNLPIPVTLTVLECPGGAWMFERVEARTHPHLDGRKLAFLSAFWIGVGLFGGTAEFLAMRSGPEVVSWAGAVAYPLMAGILWIPLTLAILWGGRRFPPAELRPSLKVDGRWVVAHGAASLAVGFLFNATFFALLLSVGKVQASELVPLATQTALRLIHINSGVYWVILLGGLVAATLAAGRPAVPDRLPFDETLTVRSGTQSVLVRVADIRWIEGAGDYVRLHLGVADHLHSERLKRLEERLDPDQFVRVHRSAIVNVAAVRKLKHLGHGDYEAMLEGGDTVRVSRTRRAQLAAVLKKRETGAPGDRPSPRPSDLQ